MKKIVCLLLTALICTLLYPSLAFANPNQLSSEEVFERDAVKQLVDEVRSKEVMPDKVDEGVSRNTSLQMKAVRSIGVYPRRKGVILVTRDPYKGLIPTGHAAIIYTNIHVVESVARGVVVGANNWDKTKHTCYGVTVNETTNMQDKIAANWCKDQEGKPYNYNYLDTGTRRCFYCSQLIWASFKDNFGIDLNTGHFGNAIHPMELVWTNKTRLIYEK